MPARHALYSKMLAERTASRNVLVLFYFIYLFIIIVTFTVTAQTKHHRWIGDQAPLKYFAQ
jgi:hypothetical protein